MFCLKHSILVLMHMYLQNPMHEKDHKMENNSKNNHYQPESGSDSSPDDSSNALIGQVNFKPHFVSELLIF